MMQIVQDFLLAVRHAGSGQQKFWTRRVHVELRPDKSQPIDAIFQYVYSDDILITLYKFSCIYIIK